MIKENELNRSREKRIYDRSSTIPFMFSGSVVKIYTGRYFNRRFLNPWVVGFKFGELTWNRKVAVYKVKQLKKKKK